MIVARGTQEDVDPIVEGEVQPEAAVNGAEETGDVSAPPSKEDGAPPSEQEAAVEAAVEEDAAVDDAAVQPKEDGDEPDAAATCENPVSASYVEDDDEDEAASVTETGEATGVAGETVDAAAHVGEVGQRPAFRNRAGRRVAGRRKAQPTTRGGHGGSKYLKRCPARDTRVERKRGGGRGQEAHGTTWTGVVRGGAHPGDEEVCMS